MFPYCSRTDSAMLAGVLLHTAAGGRFPLGRFMLMIKLMISPGNILSDLGSKEALRESRSMELYGYAMHAERSSAQ